jgi:hypothetical protein
MFDGFARNATRHGIEQMTPQWRTEMSDTKISDAAIDAGARVLADARGHGMREKAVVLAERVIAAALPHIHPQPAELVEQQGVREQFEAWAAGDGFDVTKVKGIYADPLARGAWDAWRYLAARQPGLE